MKRGSWRERERREGEGEEGSREGWVGGECLGSREEVGVGVKTQDGGEGWEGGARSEDRGGREAPGRRVGVGGRLKGEGPERRECGRRGLEMSGAAKRGCREEEEKEDEEEYGKRGLREEGVDEDGKRGFRKKERDARGGFRGLGKGKMKGKGRGKQGKKRRE